MSIFFAADVHLDDTAPAITERFLRFLQERVQGSQALYLLGDLFEAWVGDDDPAECGAAVSAGLRKLENSGTRLFFMHGNRDFLLGPEYAARCGMTLLEDPHVIELGRERTLLSHGDIFCTDDAAYQQFRAMTRNEAWRAQFLAQPLAARLAFAGQARARSKARFGELSAAGTAETVTDVNPDAVREAMQRHGVTRLIHGHTHRPARHALAEGERIVVGDWYTQAGVVVCTDAHGLRLEPAVDGSYR